MQNRPQPKNAQESLFEETENTLPSGSVAEHAFAGQANSGDKQTNDTCQRFSGPDRRRDSTGRRRGLADRRGGVSDRRGGDTIRRDKNIELHEQDISAEPGGHSEALLRDINEQLVVATIRAQTQAETAEQIAAKMAHLAEHDYLTGLPNRAVLDDRLERSIALAQRHGNQVALLYLDIDNFKHINDSLGHAAGDQLLQSIAKRLQTCIRFSDTVSRQGGDEFVVLLVDVEGEHGAVLAAQKLIAAMVEPHRIGTHSLHATLSIGISLFPDHGKDKETIIRNADTAMYFAKQKGRNNYQIFTPDMKGVP
jgi:diguanylate cyclase (GGDEF)-like protein